MASSSIGFGKRDGKTPQVKQQQTVIGKEVIGSILIRSTNNLLKT